MTGFQRACSPTPQSAPISISDGSGDEVDSPGKMHPARTRAEQPRSRTMRRKLAFCLTLVAIGVGAARPVVHAADLDPKAISIQLPADIKWVKPANGGSEQAIVAGDPAKPGLYVVLQKWLPHNNSRPHSHPNDRYITVLK